MKLFLKVFLLGLRRTCSRSSRINYVSVFFMRRRDRVNACSRFRRRINRFEIVKRRSCSRSRRGRRALGHLMIVS